MDAEEKEWQMFSVADWFRRKPDAETHKQEISTLRIVFLNRAKTGILHASLLF